MEVRHVQHVQNTNGHPALEALTVILDLQIDPHVFFLQDFLDINALCAGSIAAITTGAAAIRTLWRSGARGLPLRPFLEDTQGSTAGRKIVEFPRL